MNDLKGKRVAVIVTDGLEQIEMTSPRDAMEHNFDAQGRHITSWPTLQDDLRNAGARWEDKECIRDRNWVSSRKPDDLPVFNREMVNCFAQAKSTRSEKQDAREVRP